jgi:hypothetical protein
MLTAIAVEQGNVITEGLNVWFDFGNTQCFNPTQGTGSITAGTLFNNLAPGYSGITGSINGAVNWSAAFGGCMNLTSNSTSTLQFTTAISASFTVQIICTPGTDASPNNNWGADAGAWPQIQGANGIKWAQGFGVPTGGNFLIPILGYGASYATLSTTIVQPANGWAEYARFPNVYTFATNASNSHNTYTNNILKATDTSTRTRSNQTSFATAYLNTDIDLSNRKGLGRICAYLQYTRQLSDAEIYQNVQFYLNRFGTK